jgi:hypothetical protein
MKIPVVTMLLMFTDTPTCFFERPDRQSSPGGSPPSLIAKRYAYCRFEYTLPVPSFNRAQVRRRRCPDAGVELAQHRRMLTYVFQCVSLIESVNIHFGKEGLRRNCQHGVGGTPRGGDTSGLPIAPDPRRSGLEQRLSCEFRFK